MLAEAGQGDLHELERIEDARFEVYAKERRAALEKTKMGYNDQLVEFQIERARALAEGNRGTGGKKKAVEVRGRLEKVEIQGDDAGLEDFFGGSGDTRQNEEQKASNDEQKASDDKPKAGGQKKQKSKKSDVKAKEPTAASSSAPRRKANPAIMADEDIEDEEDLMGHYRR